MLSWEETRDQLIEAVRMSWRMPRALPKSGGSASDGPWRWLTRSARAEAGGMAWIELWRLLQDEAAREQRNRAATVPLTAEQVTWMEKRFEWLLLVPDANRKLVWLACVQLAGGRESVDWSRVRQALSAEIDRKGLYRRFVRSLAALAKALSDRDRIAAH